MSTEIIKGEAIPLKWGENGTALTYVDQFIVATNGLTMLLHLGASNVSGEVLLSREKPDAILIDVFGKFVMPIEIARQLMEAIEKQLPNNAS